MEAVIIPSFSFVKQSKSRSLATIDVVQAFILFASLASFPPDKVGLTYPLSHCNQRKEKQCQIH